MPDSARARFPSDTTLADTGDMREYVAKRLDEKIGSLMSETFEGTVNSPLDDPKNTEEKLQGVLAEWAKYVRETVGLFEPSEE